VWVESLRWGWLQRRRARLCRSRGVLIRVWLVHCATVWPSNAGCGLVPSPYSIGIDNDDQPAILPLWGGVGGRGRDRSNAGLPNCQTPTPKLSGGWASYGGLGCCKVSGPGPPNCCAVGAPPPPLRVWGFGCCCSCCSDPKYKGGWAAELLIRERSDPHSGLAAYVRAPGVGWDVIRRSYKIVTRRRNPRRGKAGRPHPSPARVRVTLTWDNSAGVVLWAGLDYPNT
jgi:hypothetical protein